MTSDKSVGSADGVVGRAEITPTGAIVAGSLGTWRVRYHVGSTGIDDGGRVKLCFRINSDWGVPQTADAGAANFVTLSTSGPARLTPTYHPRGHVRPWSKALTILVDDGYLSEGDVIDIILGDTSGGGPGFESQPYAEKDARFALFTDAGGTGAYLPVPLDGGVDVDGGPAASIDLTVPSDVVAGEPFRIGVALRDAWGNAASGRYDVSLRCDALSHLPAMLEIDDSGTCTLEAIAPQPAEVIRVHGTVPGTPITGLSNPAVVHESAPTVRRWWGDLHGQSSETCGTGPAPVYLRYARDTAFLDFAGHQGNDFELSDASWIELKDTLNRFNESGRFVTFLGYEWSGNTAAGGDYNVMFRGSDAPIHRSSLWLLSPEEARYPVCSTIAALRRQFAGRDDVMLIPHVGGRYARNEDIDDAFSPLVEVWSTHGEFEWFFQDAVARGLRVGISAGSDDHTGRLGATRPGRRAFAVRGGLLCVKADALTREALWDAIRGRATYGTTGERILVEVEAMGVGPGGEVRAAGPLEFTVTVHGTRSVERIELRRGLGEVVAVARSREAIPGGLRVSWRGARNRGREREADWGGHLTVEGTTIEDAASYAFDRRSEGIARCGNRVTWRSTTAGDTDGVNLDLSDARSGKLRIRTPFVSAEADLSTLGDEALIFPAGGLGLELRVERRRPALGLDVRTSLTAPKPAASATPYAVVVYQVDGSKAWCSPVWASPV